MISITPRFSNNLAPRRCLAALCVVATTLVVSCGGQSSGTSNSNGQGQTPDGGGTASLAMAGAYQGSVNYSGIPYTSDFLSFLTPGGDWYGLYFLTTTTASVYPDIYFGKVAATSPSSATISNLKASQFGKAVTTGSATISGSSVSNYSISLAGINLAISQPTNFAPTAIATSTGIAGSWVGGLRDSQNTADPTMTLRFSADGTLTSTSSYALCPLNIRLTQVSESAHPYYTARLEIPRTSFCPRTPVTSATLDGIAFIHAAPPESGKTKRLEIIVVDASGSGISFRGDQ